MSCRDSMGTEVSAVFRIALRGIPALLPTHLLLEDVEGQGGLAIMVGATRDGLSCRKGSRWVPMAQCCPCCRYCTHPHAWGVPHPVLCSQGEVALLAASVWRVNRGCDDGGRGSRL